MLKKIVSSVLLLVFFSACAPSRVSQNGPVRPKPFVTPWEYYQNSRPAVLTPEDKVEVQKAEQVHSTHGETKSDKTQTIIIGVLVGVLVIGGTVAGILLTR